MLSQFFEAPARIRAIGCSPSGSLLEDFAEDLRKLLLWLGQANMQATKMYTRPEPSIKLEALEAVTAPRLRSGRFRASDKLLASPTGRPFMRRE